MSKLYQNILLPVDGSQQSIDAFKKGVIQAKQLGSKVYLVRVIKDTNANINIAERESFLTSLEEFARKENVSIHTELIFGDPRTEIAENLINQWDIDLIVMGATGKGRIQKMLLGSITDYVVRYAKCDVLISR